MDNLAHPEYLLFKHRLKSFTSWPPQLSQNKTDLAQAGLFYNNVSDRVVCFACGVMLYEWKPHDDPWIEHCKHARHCVYLNMVGGARLFLPQHDGSNTRGVPATSNEMLHQQRTNPSNPFRGLWAQGATAGLDSPDV